MMASQTIQEKFVELQNSKQTPKSSRPKIQRVAYFRRKIPNFGKYYTPKFVSIGPIHHERADLGLGEKYKLTWAAEYIENTGLSPEELHKKIAANIDELKGRFSDDVLNYTGKFLEGFESLEEKLSWMLFVDGCSLLHILENARRYDTGKMNIKVDQLFLVMMDVVLLENQLPYEVLRLLWKDDESELIKIMRNFIIWTGWASRSEMEEEGEGEHIEHIVSILEMEEEREGEPTHLLHLLRKIILSPSNSKIRNNEADKENWSKKSSDEKAKIMNTIYMNIKDLKAVGIRLKSSKARRPTDIDFSKGWFTAELTLPEIVVDDSSATTFLNLIAYEMSQDFDNDYRFCSFAAFMSSLINHPEDVKVLRSKGILLNSLGSDEQVADLFNIISTELVPISGAYFEIRARMHDHYDKSKSRKMRGYYTYFRIATVIAIGLTFIQTVFTVYPAFK